VPPARDRDESTEPSCLPLVFPRRDAREDGDPAIKSDFSASQLPGRPLAGPNEGLVLIMWLDVAGLDQWRLLIEGSMMITEASG
jgi:hypothetical protein